MGGVQLLIHFTLFLWFSSSTAIVSAASNALIAKPNCQSDCGGIEIPYPFGIGPGCYIDRSFEILCDDSTSLPKPFLNVSTRNLEVLEILATEGTLKVRNPVTVSANCKKQIGRTRIIRQAANLGASPFLFSQKNSFTVVGCGVMASLNSTSDGLTISASCSSKCDIATNATSTCNGLDCCQTNIPSFFSTFQTSFVSQTNPCNYAFLADQVWFLLDDESQHSSFSGVSACQLSLTNCPAWIFCYYLLLVFCCIAVFL